VGRRRCRHDLASASTASHRTRSSTNLEVTGGEKEREIVQLLISFADLMHSICAKKHASRAADDGEAQVEEQSALLLLLAELDGHAHEKQRSLSFLSYLMNGRCSGSRAVKCFSGN